MTKNYLAALILVLLALSSCSGDNSEPQHGELGPGSEARPWLNPSEASVPAFQDCIIKVNGTTPKTAAMEDPNIASATIAGTDIIVHGLRMGATVMKVYTQSDITLTAKITVTQPAFPALQQDVLRDPTPRYISADRSMVLISAEAGVLQINTATRIEFHDLDHPSRQAIYDWNQAPLELRINANTVVPLVAVNRTETDQALYLQLMTENNQQVHLIVAPKR